MQINKLLLNSMRSTVTPFSILLYIAPLLSVAMFCMLIASKVRSGTNAAKVYGFIQIGAAVSAILIAALFIAIFRLNITASTVGIRTDVVNVNLPLFLALAVSIFKFFIARKIKKALV